MRRFHLIELHEQPWLPSSIRDEITDTLQFGVNLLNAYGPVAPLLRRALGTTFNRVTSGQSVVDLCSGGAGPWLELLRQLESPSVHVRLTDRFPNLAAFQKVSTASAGQITFHPASVDAMNVPAELQGFRTMFTAFHHFSPEDAAAILRGAVNAGEGIGVFEITRRSPLTIALIFPWVLLLIVCTPWVRPFRWSRLLWTYLVPIIPAVLLFDGVVSCLRTYRPAELRGLASKLHAPGYQWEIGEIPGVLPVTYLIGVPPESS